jgi:hypothetical protein
MDAAELEAIWNLTPTPQPDDVFLVRFREAGSKRYVGLGDGALAPRLAQFSTQAHAAEAIRWMFANNPGAFDSGQIVINKTVAQTLMP